MGDVVQLFGTTDADHRRFWNEFGDMFADPRNVDFRKAAREMPGEMEKLFTVRPELRDFKEPETEGMLVVTVKLAFEPGTMHAADVEGWCEMVFDRFQATPDVRDWVIEDMAVHIVMPKDQYRKDDVFDSPIKVTEIEEW